MRADFKVANAAERVEGPLLFLKRTVNIGLNEALYVIGRDGVERLGRVATLDEDSVIVEVLEKTAGLGVEDTVVSMLGEPVCFDLVRGQKLPLFSGGGLPHDRLATSIAQRARLRDSDSGEFAVVFVGIGVSHDVAESFRTAMESSGALGHTVMFLNRADESSAQRLLAPRYALTAAEYLAFVEGRHVLVIMTDMTNYCEALREVSASHGEIPGRKGFPGYMYSDLASLFERAGCLHGNDGTLTQLPILTLPGDDIGHPIPDLTGYITEGQIVLDRELDRRAVYPPINVLPSLSRLMDYGTGEGFTNADHPALASQLFAAYANARRVRVLASVMGQEGLSDIDRDYLAFGDAFEEKLISQATARTLEDSMAIGWEILGLLAETELTRLSNEQIIRYIRREKARA